MRMKINEEIPNPNPMLMSFKCTDILSSQQQQDLGYFQDHQILQEEFQLLKLILSGKMRK